MAEQSNNVVLNFTTDGEVQYAQTLKQINMVMTTAAKEYSAHIAAMGKDADATAKLAAEKQKLETQMAASAEKVKMLNADYQAMANGGNATAEELQKLYNQLLTAETAHAKLDNAMTRVNEGLSEESIAARTAQDALKGLKEVGSTLEAEQRKLASAFELEAAKLGESATEAERLELSQRKLAAQTALSSKSISNLEDQLEQAKAAYGDNSNEALRLETQLNQARTAFENFGNGLEKVETESDKAKNALNALKAEGSTLEAEQKKLISAFELESAQLGENASDTEKLELANRKLTAQTKLAEKAIENIENQLDQAKKAYGENSDEVVRLETQLNNARTTMAQFGNSLESVQNDAQDTESSLGKLGGAFQALGGIVAGLGLASIISAALAEAGTINDIDITFNVPEESKVAVRSALSEIRSYGIDGEEALEGMRRQWALNKDATDAANQKVVEGAAVISKVYNGIDFVELIQEINEISKELGGTNEEAMDLVYNLLSIGFPPDQVDIISEYGNQFQRLGYTIQEVQGLFAAAIATGTFNIDNLMDGLKEGRVKAAEFGKGLSDSMMESVREVVGGTEKASDDQLKSMQEGFSKQEKLLVKSLSLQSEELTKSHNVQQKNLSKSLNEEFKIIAKSYEDRSKTLEKSLQAQYNKVAKSYDRQQKALEKSLAVDFKNVSKNYDDQQKALEKRIAAEYDVVVKNYDNQKRALDKSLELEVVAFEKASREKMKLIDEEYYERMKLVDEEKYNQLKALDEQIDALNQKTIAEDKAMRDRENNEKRAELELKARTARTRRERNEALVELQAMEERILLENAREERKEQIDLLNAQKEDVKEVSDAKKEALKVEGADAKDAASEQAIADKQALKERQETQKDSFNEEKEIYLKMLSERNKDEIEFQKELFAAKKETLKEEQDAQKEALKERNALSLAAISEANQARMDAEKEVTNNALEAVREEQDARRESLSERLAIESKAVQEAHAEELESFKKMNAEKLEIAKNPPDSAAVQAVFDQLEGWGAAVAKGGEEGAKAFEDMVRWLNEIEDSTLRNAIGTEMFGSVWEDQGDNIIETILGADDALKNMEGSQKSLQDAIDKTNNEPLAEIKTAYESITESLGPLLVVVADVMGAFAKFATDNPRITSAFVAIAAVVSVLVGAFAALAPAFAAIPAIIPVLTGAFAKVMGVISKLGPILNGLRIAFAALTGPIGLIVAAVIGLAIIIYKNWDGIWTTTKKIFGAVGDFLSKWGKKTIDLFIDIAKKTYENFLKIKDFMMQPIEKAVGFIDKSITFVKDLFGKLVLKFPDLNIEIFEKAKEAVKKAIDAIKGFFDFEFKWPELKSPKFEVEGSMNPLKWFDEGLPKIDVKWNAKGGIFTRPTIFGASNGQMQGAGEAGPEAVLPLNSETLGAIGRSIAETMDANDGGDVNITIQIPIDGEVVARKTVKYTLREMYKARKKDEKGRR